MLPRSFRIFLAINLSDFFHFQSWVLIARERFKGVSVSFPASNWKLSFQKHASNAQVIEAPLTFLNEVPLLPLSHDHACGSGGAFPIR